MDARCAMALCYLDFPRGSHAAWHTRARMGNGLACLFRTLYLGRAEGKEEE